MIYSTSSWMMMVTKSNMTWCPLSQLRGSMWGSK